MLYVIQHIHLYLCLIVSNLCMFFVRNQLWWALALSGVRLSDNKYCCWFSDMQFCAWTRGLLLKRFSVLFHVLCDGWNKTILYTRNGICFSVSFQFYFNCEGTIGNIEMGDLLAINSSHFGLQHVLSCSAYMRPVNTAYSVTSSSSSPFYLLLTVHGIINEHVQQQSTQGCEVLTAVHKTTHRECRYIVCSDS